MAQKRMNFEDELIRTSGTAGAKEPSPPQKLESPDASKRTECLRTTINDRLHTCDEAQLLSPDLNPTLSVNSP